LFKDVRGLKLTTEHQEAVEAFDVTVYEFLASGRDTGPLLQSLDETDPNMLMGVCLRGYLMKMANLKEWESKSLEVLKRANELALSATPREQMHVQALTAWCAGNLTKTARIWDTILINYPLDLLALRLAHNMHFFLGDIWRMRDSIARVLPHWDEKIPGYGFVLGCHCFALEEAGDYSAAEQHGRRAVDINVNDIWAGHAVAHVLEMQGRRKEGIEWISRHEKDWRKRGLFAKHLWWHRALHYLEFEEFDSVLDAYDRQFWPEPSEDNIDICNSSSMLMRLHMVGIDVGTRWGSVADISSTRTEDRFRPFNDLHFVMALAMSGRITEAEHIIRSMREFCHANDSDRVSVSAVYKDPAIPVGEAIISYSKHDYKSVVTSMLEARYQMRTLGGSWAQRDVWVRMLIDAAIKNDEPNLSRSLLAERIATQPLSGPTWILYSKILKKTGDMAAATAARIEGEKLLAV
tara:strand:- start:2204 stop:3595 length:1392 start_codon:yes stop_codon:yes gene_type:complete